MNALRLIVHNPSASMLVVFVAASAAAVAMLVARWFATGQLGFLYLPYNLFLARALRG
jgi:hypothetical protein